MRVLHIGDIVGDSGRKAVSSILPSIKKSHSPDLIIANCENLAGGFGVTEKTLREVFDAGVDVMTSGNHIWDKKEALKIITQESRLIRPANYPPGVPGNTHFIFNTMSGAKCLVFNLLGRIFMDPLDCPFRTADKIIEEFKDRVNIFLLDFHAEATSEKLAIAWYLQGRVSAVIGTHTHVQTADERILPLGTAYITDAGMTGSINSVIGMRKEEAIQRFLTFIPHKFEVAKDDIQLQGVIFDVDEKSGKSSYIERVKIKLGESRAR
jgi:metallophosphoesterase (TIGR00282 family)